MPDGPRLPTSAFGFLAVVILSIGGGWWVNAAPPAPPAPAPVAVTVAPTRTAVVTPRADGSRRAYMGRRAGSMRSWQHRAAATAAYTTTTWPCRTTRIAASPAEPVTGARLAHGLRCAGAD